MGTQYLQGVLSRRGISNATMAINAANQLTPMINKWGNGYIENISFSGSYAKGTAVQGGTDIDLFISLSSRLNDSLSDIYNTLYNCLVQNGYATARKQNVSIGTTVNGFKIDLVPAKRQDAYGQDHSLYRRKADTWTKTNVQKHINLVSGSGRLSEIRAMKLWRNHKNIDFPSFYLELTVIEALRGQGLLSSGYGDLSKNIVHVLNYLKIDFKTARFVDPANTNNIISDDLTLQEKTLVVQAAERALAGSWEQFIS